PIPNLTGGLLIGVGMVVARSCASGLFYKLGSGMLGAAVGLAGLAGGELAVRHLDLPGNPVLEPGDDATLAGVAGMPRVVVALRTRTTPSAS
ncbi:MAG: YeeE/YedE thiosulfate transporter family protein, partial [Acidimicrobiales bacterium]